MAATKAEDDREVTVPQSFIDRIKERPSRKLAPLTEDEIEFYTEFSPDNPEFLAGELANITRWNYLVDLEQDCLRQYEEKGYAEVGVDFSKGIKQLFILSQPPQHQLQVINDDDDDAAG